MRFLVAGAALTLWALSQGAARPTAAQWRSSWVVGALLFLGGNGGVVWAEQYVASGVVALLIATEPLWIVLLGWARSGGTRPGARVFVGLLVGFAGVWLLVGQNQTPQGAPGGAAMLATIVVLSASVSWAIGSLYSVGAALPSSPLLGAGMQMIAGGALLSVAGTILGEWKTLNLSGVSAVSLAAFLYLIVFGALVAFTAYSWLLRVATPARASTYAYVNPLVAVILGWAVAGEALTSRMMLAAGVIVASVVLISSQKATAAPKRATTSVESA